MTSLTILLPEPTLQWLEKAVRGGGYADAGDYLSALIDRDREERALTFDELQALLSQAEASGISERTIDEIAAEARVRVARG